MLFGVDCLHCAIGRLVRSAFSGVDKATYSCANGFNDDG